MPQKLVTLSHAKHIIDGLETQHIKIQQRIFTAGSLLQQRLRFDQQALAIKQTCNLVILYLMLQVRNYLL